MIEIVKYAGQPADEMLRRAGAQAADVTDKVRAILEEVRTRGDLPMPRTGWWDIAEFLEGGND